MVDDLDPPGGEPGPDSDNPIARILTFDPLAGLVERTKVIARAWVLPQIAKLWREDLAAYEALVLRLKKETPCRVSSLEGAVAALASARRRTLRNPTVAARRNAKDGPVLKTPRRAVP